MTRKAPPCEESHLPATTPPLAPGVRAGTLCLCRPNSEKLWVEEKLATQILALHTAQGVRGGRHLTLNDLCLEELGFLYLGKKSCQKESKPEIPKVRRVLLLGSVHTGSTNSSLERTGGSMFTP